MIWLEKTILYFGSIERTILMLVICCLVLLILSCLLKILSWGIRGIRRLLRGVRSRRYRRGEIRRQLQYTLPERGNEYLRARLHTTLAGREVVETVTDKQNAGIRLEYAQKMLTGIRASNLSPVERLEVEEIARLVALYLRQEKWANSDLKSINEVFARLLKLSAKYEVAV